MWQVDVVIIQNFQSEVFIMDVVIRNDDEEISEVFDMNSDILLSWNQLNWMGFEAFLCVFYEVFYRGWRLARHVV